MEVNRGGFSFGGIDNQAREEALDLVEAAQTPEELLTSVIPHFDERILSMTAAGVLSNFTDESLSDVLRDQPGFDPTLYKATVLFELSHISDDESILPEHINNMIKFWQTAGGRTQEDIDSGLNAQTKRTHYRPFGVLSQQVKLSIIMHSMGYSKEHPVESDEPAKAKDEELAEDIDGKGPMRMFAGSVELKFYEPPVLTRQLQRDLMKLYPRAVIEELRDRFLDDQPFEAIQPMIDRIIHERKEGITPSDAELLASYNQVEQRAEYMFPSRAPEVQTPEEILTDAREYFYDMHRRPEALIHKNEVYVLAHDKWYSSYLYESDTEVDTYRRRIFQGDMAVEHTQEVPLEDRELINKALDKLQGRDKHPDKAPDYIITDIYGEWPPAN